MVLGGTEKVSSSSGFVSVHSSSQSYNLIGTQGLSVMSTATVQHRSLSSRSNLTVMASPPALPAKQRSRRERHQSQYDNVPLSTHPPPLPLKKKHSKYIKPLSLFQYTNFLFIFKKNTSAANSDLRISKIKF